MKIFNSFKILTENRGSVLGMEHTEVMSAEDMEVNLFNEMIYGVSYDVENQSSDALKGSSFNL